MAALAEEYDLANGNITVKADNSGQYVSQEGGVTNEKQTTETVIKQADNTADTGNTITVETSGGAKAELTIEDLNVSSGNTSAIDVKGSSEAEITLKGDNKLKTDDASVIHVSEGDVPLPATEPSMPTMTLTAITQKSAATTARICPAASISPGTPR